MVICLTARAQDLISVFDPPLIRYYKVDSCLVHLTETSYGQPEKRLAEKYIFDGMGNVTQKITYSSYEDEAPTITEYEYNMNGQLIKSTTQRPERDPIITWYAYRGKFMTGKKVNLPEEREYEIFITDDGLRLGMIGRSLIDEKDTLTGELTGRKIMGNIEEYEYRYNRFNKVTREIFYYYGNEFHNKEFDYGPNGNGPLLSMKIYRNGSRQPDSKTVYTYAGNSLLQREEQTDLVTGDLRILDYEYFYAPSSPMNQQPKAPQTPVKFMPTKKGVK